MTADTKAIFNQLKHNPEFLNETAETMGDALCLLILETEGSHDSENQNIISALAKARLDLRKLVE